MFHVEQLNDGGRGFLLRGRYNIRLPYYIKIRHRLNEHIANIYITG